MCFFKCRFVFCALHIVIVPTFREGLDPPVFYALGFSEMQVKTVEC